MHNIQEASTKQSLFQPNPVQSVAIHVRPTSGTMATTAVSGAIPLIPQKSEMMPTAIPWTLQKAGHDGGAAAALSCQKCQIS